MAPKTLNYYDTDLQRWVSPYVTQDEITQLNTNISNVSNEINEHTQFDNTEAHTIDNIIGLRDAISNSAMSQTTATLTYYVDSVNGNDDNDGLTSVTAFKTIQKSINELPKIINHRVSIQIAQGTYNESITIEGFIGTEGININSNNSIINVNGFLIRSCECNITIASVTFSGTTSNKIDFRACKSILVNNCRDETNAAIFAIINNCDYAVFTNNFISNKTNTAISANNASNVIVTNINGENNTVAFTSSNLSRIFKNTGINITATTLEVTSVGGQVL